MFVINIAKLNIGIDEKYSHVKKLCKDYIVDTDDIDFCVSVSDEEIKAEQSLDEGKFSKGYCESICIYRQICKKIPEFDAFLMHAAVIELDGKSYAFSAKSGTGKSTHIMLWQKIFGNRCRIINGDKPIMRRFDGKFYACGTPWCGKENFGENAVSPIVAFCFIERSENNFIEKISQDEILSRIFHQLFVPQDMPMQDKFFALLDDFLAQTPAFLLRCNMEDEAAHVASNCLMSSSLNLS